MAVRPLQESLHADAFTYSSALAFHDSVQPASAERPDCAGSWGHQGCRARHRAGARRGRGDGLLHRQKHGTGKPSPYKRPETIDETAAMIAAAGGRAIAVRVDHAVEAEVEALVAPISSRSRAIWTSWSTASPARTRLMRQWASFWKVNLHGGRPGAAAVAGFTHHHRQTRCANHQDREAQERADRRDHGERFPGRRRQPLGLVGEAGGQGAGAEHGQRAALRTG